MVGLRPLAAQLGVTYQAVQKFQKTRVPAEQVLNICAATEWRITPSELRPDIYPHPLDGLPEHLRVAPVNRMIESCAPEMQKKTLIEAGF